MARKLSIALAVLLAVFLATPDLDDTAHIGN